MGSWATVVSGNYTAEIVRTPDTVLSFQEMLNDISSRRTLVGLWYGPFFGSPCN